MIELAFLWPTSGTILQWNESLPPYSPPTWRLQPAYGGERDGHVRPVAAHRKELFEPEIAKHHGRIFKLMGDGLLAEFGSVVDAVECAAALQREMARRNEGLPDNRRIDVRIGVHVGDVIVEGEDRHGDAVNVAARLQQLADPGAICVSQRVVDHVKHKVALGLELRGEERLKNIVDPVRVYRVRLDGVRDAPRPELALPDKPSIAVLPFQNIGVTPNRSILRTALWKRSLPRSLGFGSCL
jgi:hypothetical protein